MSVLAIRKIKLPKIKSPGAKSSFKVSLPTLNLNTKAPQPAKTKNYDTFNDNC